MDFAFARMFSIHLTSNFSSMNQSLTAAIREFQNGDDGQFNSPRNDGFEEFITFNLNGLIERIIYQIKIHSEIYDYNYY